MNSTLRVLQISMACTGQTSHRLISTLIILIFVALDVVLVSICQLVGVGDLEDDVVLEVNVLTGHREVKLPEIVMFRFHRLVKAVVLLINED